MKEAQEVRNAITGVARERNHDLTDEQIRSAIDEVQLLVANDKMQTPLMMAEIAVMRVTA